MVEEVWEVEEVEELEVVEVEVLEAAIAYKLFAWPMMLRVEQEVQIQSEQLNPRPLESCVRPALVQC